MLVSQYTDKKLHSLLLPSFKVRSSGGLWSLPVLGNRPAGEPSERTNGPSTNSSRALAAAFAGTAAVNHSSEKGSDRTCAKERVGGTGKLGLRPEKMRNNFVHLENAAGEVVDTVRIGPVLICLCFSYCALSGSAKN